MGLIDARGDRKEDTRRQAIQNVFTSLDTALYFPDRVLIGHWASFLFFQSDWMFSGEFADVLHELLRLESAAACCLVNLTLSTAPYPVHADGIFVDELTTATDYYASLRGEGPATGWLYRMDRYGCASDVGGWCIYCEKDNDIGVFGVRSSEAVDRFAGPLGLLGAKPIADLLDQGAFPTFPFDRLTPVWRQRLSACYG